MMDINAEINMDSSSNRVIDVDEDWNTLFSSGYLQEGDSHDGITYVTDGVKWGAKDWQGNHLISIKYDSVIYEEFAYGCFHFVCIDDRKIDILDSCGKPKFLGLKDYDGRDFDPVRYFICLANSYKRGGRCIAGVEVDCNNTAMLNNGNPRWMRPISETLHGEIPNHVADLVRMLSLVRIVDGLPCPTGAHRENLSYSKMEVCSLPFPAQPKLLNQFIDNTHQFIFGNRGKAVSVDAALELDYSLMFIRVQNAKAYIDENRNKSKNRMRFMYHDTEYDLPITDPTFLDELRNDTERFAIIPNVYLTLSLGLEFEGWHHKLVAGVIIPDIVEEQKGNKKDWFDEYERELVRLLDMKNEIDEQINEVRAKILQGMESHGVEKIHSEQFSVSYTPARTVVQFDSKSFRMENEKLYARYCKPRVREASIVVKRNVKE